MPSYKCLNASLCLVQAEKERYSAFGKIRGLLTSASEELLDVPLYYNLHAVCKTLHVTPPSGDTVRSALINAGAPNRTLAFVLC